MRETQRALVGQADYTDASQMAVDERSPAHSAPLNSAQVTTYIMDATQLLNQIITAPLTYLMTDGTDALHTMTQPIDNLLRAEGNTDGT